MGTSSVLVAVVAGALTVALWAYVNRPSEEVPWHGRIRGVSFSPFKLDQSPATGRLPTEADIAADLALVARKSDAIRTYGVEGSLAEIPALARAHGMTVMLGAWVDHQRDRNEVEIARVIDVARAHPNVTSVVVGNEVVLRGDVPVEELIGYIERVRAAVKQPVSTAEPWHVWLDNPDLVRHVDFIAVHMLPYWEGVDVHLAVDHVAQRMRELERAYPGTRIVMTEVGWPSYGRARGEAVASVANQAIFLRRFLARAAEERWRYYLMEAFDQPWKRSIEGAVGAYWGIWDVRRERKFPFYRPVVPVREWRRLAGLSVLMGVSMLALFYWDGQTLRTRGRGFLAAIVYAASTLIVWVVYDYTRQYLTATSVVVGFLLLLGMLGVILVVLAEAHEWAEAHWVRMRRRAFEPVRAADETLPMVSVHVPAYNEPPEMLIETLDALARLDYPRYEVIVVDNNTRDEAVWRPVEAHCRRLGPRFRFFHVDPLAGFKAGALNYALRRTAEEAEVVAVIDSDYVVDRRWLRELAPLFARPRITVVQAPQDYRDGNVNAFKTVCYAEYRGFFYIGMITRNERNAIIQHGTMTMIRRRVLEEVGGWAEWCITEDAELGLRVFASGHEAAYVPKSYGRGLMPDTFLDYKKQRFRWAYGAVQILRRHAAALFGPQGGLSVGQRYHFIAGWLPWIADGLNLVFNLAAILWSLAMILFPRAVEPPLVICSALPLVLFGFKLVKLVYLYRTRVGANLRQTLAAATAGLALTHTIGIAVVTGLLTTRRPFFRTPKQTGSHALAQALAGCREETLIMFGLWLAAYGVLTAANTDVRGLGMWAIVLCVQSIPYAVSVAVSLLGAMPGVPASVFGRVEDMDERAHLVLDVRQSPAGH
ncbi:MAG TPA: glycosyltransferase [Thermodesulfobacteriota bacterium]